MSNLIRTVKEILEKRNLKQITTTIEKIENGMKDNIDAIGSDRISKGVRQVSIEMNILLSKRLINLYEAKETLLPTKTKEEEDKDFWKSRRRAKELAAMDNQPTENWDVHGSY